MSGAEYVRMHVKNGLTGSRARVEHKPELPIGMVVGDLLCGRNDFGQQAGVTSGKLDDISVLLGFRHDDDVHGCLRSDVAEGDHPIAVEYDIGGNLPRNNAREHRRLL